MSTPPAYAPAYHPESTSEYQLLMVNHSKGFEYPAWLHYDTEFRRWAATNQYTQWSQIHPQFYAFAFTGRGIAVGWCPICQIDGGNHIYYSSPSIQPPPLSILISTVCSYCSISLKLSTLLIH